MERRLKLADEDIDGTDDPPHISTPLMTATVRDDLTGINLILSAGDNVNEQNEHGCSALMWTIPFDRTKIASRLIDAGADVNHTDAVGRSVLSVASKAGNTEILQLLLNSSLDINYAQTSGTGEVGYTALMNAVIRPDNSDTITLLIENGIDIDAQNQNGQTALMIAAWFGHLHNVRSLIEAGANHRLRDGSQMTALDTAKAQAEAEVVEYLESLEE